VHLVATRGRSVFSFKQFMLTPAAAAAAAVHCLLSAVEIDIRVTEATAVDTPENTTDQQCPRLLSMPYSK